MPDDRGVVSSIERLRLKRYNEKGPGSKPARAPRPSIVELRGDMAKAAKKKRKPRRRR